MLISAAKKHGSRGVGYELDAELAAAAVANVRRERVEHLVQIIRCGAVMVNFTQGNVSGNARGSL